MSKGNIAEHEAPVAFPVVSGRFSIDIGLISFAEVETAVLNLPFFFFAFFGDAVGELRMIMFSLVEEGLLDEDEVCGRSLVEPAPSASVPLLKVS